MVTAAQQFEYMRKAISAPVRVEQDWNDAFFGRNGTGVSAINRGRVQRHYSAYKDTVFSAISPVAKIVAGQNIRVGRIVNEASDMESIRSKKSWQAAAELMPFRSKSMKDNIEPYDSHWFVEAMMSPNMLQSDWEVKYCVTASLLVAGWVSLVIESNPNASGKFDIYYVPTSWLENDSDSGALGRWKLRLPTGGKPIDLARNNVVQFKFPDPGNPFGAYSPTQSQARAINIDDATLTAQQAAMDQGINPKLLIYAGTLPANKDAGVPEQRVHMKPEERRRLVSSLKSYVGGAINNGEPLIIDGMIDKVDSFGMKPAELDYMNSSEMNMKRIRMGIGTNDYLAGNVNTASRAAAGVAQKAGYDGQVNPLISLMSAGLTTGLRFAGLIAQNEVVWIEKAIAFEQDLIRERISLFPDLFTRGQAKHFIKTGEVMLDPDDRDDEPYTPSKTAPAAVNSTDAANATDASDQSAKWLKMWGYP